MKKLDYLYLYFLCILSMPFSTLIGQSLPTSQDYIANVQHFSMESGLSHRGVHIPFQDSRGFIWLGTQYGLNRFNGKKFEIFTEEKHGLAHNQVNKILEDADGWLWIFHTRSSRSFKNFIHLSFLNIYTLEVKTIEERFGDEFPVPVESIHSSTNKNGSIYLGGKNGQMIHFHPQLGFTMKQLVDEGDVNVQFFSDENRLWVEHLHKNKTISLLEIDTTFNIIWKQDNFDWTIHLMNDKKELWCRKNEDLTVPIQSLKLFSIDKNKQSTPITFSNNLFENAPVDKMNKLLYYQEQSDLYLMYSFINTYNFPILSKGFGFAYLFDYQCV